MTIAFEQEEEMLTFIRDENIIYMYSKDGTFQFDIKTLNYTKKTFANTTHHVTFHSNDGSNNNVYMHYTNLYSKYGRKEYMIYLDWDTYAEVSNVLRKWYLTRNKKYDKNISVL